MALSVILGGLVSAFGPIHGGSERRGAAFRLAFPFTFGFPGCPSVRTASVSCGLGVSPECRACRGTLLLPRAAKAHHHAWAQRVVRA